MQRLDDFPMVPDARVSQENTLVFVKVLSEKQRVFLTDFSL
jgi:hypothetical protein